jgi:hypothetical protein
MAPGLFIGLLYWASANEEVANAIPIARPKVFMLIILHLLSPTA